MQHAGDLGQAVASDPTPYHLTGGAWSILDLSAPQSGYAFAQTPPPDSTPPTFVSSELNTATRVLTITFSETIDATNVDAAKIHIRESGNYTGGGITMITGELDTTTDARTILFTLAMPRLATVTGLTTPELTIEPGAVRNTSYNLIDGTFDVSTATFAHSFNATGQDDDPEGMAFSNDGAKMFVVGHDGKDINEYTLSTPFDISTANFTNVTLDVRSQDYSPRGMAFSNNGAKMFVVGWTGEEINEYALSTSFDISTANFTHLFEVHLQDIRPHGMAFSNDGAKMFVVGNAGNDINEYTLSTPFDISTANFTGNDEGFSVSDQDRFPAGVAFSNDGAKMFVVGRTGANIHEYALSTPFDLSTAAFANVTFSVSLQETEPQGMAFSNDGAKMFIVGSSDGGGINEYTLSSVYLITLTDEAAIDNTPPELTLTGSSSVTIEANVAYTDAGADCLDGVDGTITPTKTFDDVDTSQVGSYTVTYSCADAATNTVTVSRTVIVEDTTPPELTLTGSSSVTIELVIPIVMTELSVLTPLMEP